MIDNMIILITGSILVLLVTYELMKKKQRKHTELIYLLMLFYLLCTLAKAVCHV